MSVRPAAARRKTQTWRNLHRLMERESSKWQMSWMRFNDARDKLIIRAAEETERFGVHVPPEDPFLLDVLEQITVADDGTWSWSGVRNNRDLATVRVDRRELSLVRYLAIKFGVIDEDDHGLLYPTTSTDDVNPFNRRLRRAAEPFGNPLRYDDTPNVQKHRSYPQVATKDGGP